MDASSFFILRDTDLFGLVTAVGCALGIFLYKRRKTALPLMPGLWFLVRYINDLGVGPLIQVSLGLSPFAIFGYTSHETERIGALFLGLQGGIALAIGFLFIKWKMRSKGDSLPRSTPQSPAGLSPSPIAWQAAVLWGGFGLSLWLLWLRQVGGLADAIAGMHMRIFSIGFEQETPFSVYVRMGAGILQLATLVMVGLCNAPKSRRFFSGCFIAFSVFFLFLTGGRTRVAFFLASCAIVWHERVRKLSLADLCGLSAAGAALLIAISFIRGGMSELNPATTMTAAFNSFFTIDRVESIAWIQSIFPGRAAFTHGSSLVRSLINLFPILSFPGASSMWGTIADTLFGGQRFTSISGGWNFHGAAELYMNFGTTGVWIGYIALGGILALLFYHLRNHRHELLPSVALALALTAFSVGVGTRPFDTLGAVLFQLWMLGCIAATMTPRKPLSQAVLGLSLICALLFFGWKFSGSDELKYALGVAMFLWLPLSIRAALTTRDIALRDSHRGRQT
jgi:oligosaccharide repeat unit polymerase